MEKSKLQKAGNILFFIGVAIELLVMMTDHSAITLPYRGRVTHVAFVLFGLKILTNRYSKKEWIVIVLAGLLGTLSYFTCTDEYVIRIVVMLVASKNIDYKKCIYLILYVTIVGTALIMLLSIAGKMGNMVDVRDYGRGIVESRWCLGFSHANNVHDMLWYLVALGILAYGEKLSYKYYSVVFIVNIGVLLLTRSRTGFATVCFLVMIGLLTKYVKSVFDTAIPYMIGIFMTLACIGVSIWASAVSSVYYEPPKILNLLNGFLTQRLEMDYEHANISDWMLLPGERNIIAVDDGFAYLFYVYGIIVGIAFIAFIMYLMYRIYLKKNGLLLAVLVTAIIVMFMESTYAINTSILCNLVFVIFLIIWNQNNEQIQEQK